MKCIIFQIPVLNKIKIGVNKDDKQYYCIIYEIFKILKLTNSISGFYVQVVHRKIYLK